MIASSDERGFLRFEQNLKTGSKVRLIAGPFAEQLGILDQTIVSIPRQSRGL
jgi:hypothetical protein